MSTDAATTFDSSYRVFMTALFVGMTDALFSLFFHVFYGGHIPDFSGVINVPYFIFGSLFIYLLIAFIYLFFLRTFKRGVVIYIAVFTLLSICGQLAIHSCQFSPGVAESVAIRGELAGLAAIYGVSVILLIPLLH